MESGVSCVKGVVNDDADFDDFHENYSLGAILGRGGFGTVYAAVRNRDGLAVAVKHILKNRVQSWGKVRLFFYFAFFWQLTTNYSMYSRTERKQELDLCL
jgi:serine/threonine protein kinase